MTTGMNATGLISFLSFLLCFSQQKNVTNKSTEKDDTVFISHLYIAANSLVASTVTQFTLIPVSFIRSTFALIASGYTNNVNLEAFKKPELPNMHLIITPAIVFFSSLSTIGLLASRVLGLTGEEDDTDASAFWGTLAGIVTSMTVSKAISVFQANGKKE